jgi:hypothetical protein
MLLWRIGTNILPTKDLLAQKVGINDSSCPLCGEAEETGIHLFFKCNVARAIWFGSCWGLRTESLQLNSNEDILKLVLKPPPHLSMSINQNLIEPNCTSLIMALLWRQYGTSEIK